MVATVDLSPDFSAGKVVARTANADFSTPTTIAQFGSWLYAVNARFGTTGSAVEYWVTQLARP